MNKRITLFIMVLLSISFIMAGCSSSKDKNETNQPDGQTSEPRQFETGEAVITLSSDFTENPQDKYTFQYSSPEALCIGQKELKTDIANAGYVLSSLAEYAGVVMQNVGINSECYEHGQSLYFEWDKNINDTNYSYIGFVTETDDAYWLIQFAALKESYSELRNDFFTYYDSFKVNS